MYKIRGNDVETLEPATFSELGMSENDIEELLRLNISMLHDEEESLLVVGKQVRNEKQGRSDLTAVDQNGNIVLIEIKRDRRDIEHRKEAFEFQAIRYAASYATIKDPDELVEKVYTPYLANYYKKEGQGDLTYSELGARKLTEFLVENGSEQTFNLKQRIMLVASDFDEQTLSAVAWLNSNGVEISCLKLIPYQIDGSTYIYVDKLLPIMDYGDYYVNISVKSGGLQLPTSKKKDISRRSLPKIDKLLEWGAVHDGDILKARGREEEGVLLPNGKIRSNGEEVSLQSWLQGIFGWSSVQTYHFTIHKESGKSLGEIRAAFMEQLEKESIIKE
ncbi:hypothetical protein CR205_11825 [Alteribacter lacisalsi]|uniref:RAMA domain-containing protein n=1 Tax=Alteribacter lacisalsi TaxID=2045244 RepID=A0A2W0H6Q4_9BACI|nr:hypothetical protein [Alteribacter lacisalsi]PYZ96406.1 hypothetical protein CR205_11825 [Alteribacter lacisalsi]